MNYRIFPLLLSLPLLFHSLAAEDGFSLFEQGRMREEQNLRFMAGVYPNLSSIGAEYNINRYLSIGGFVQKDYNMQMLRLYSTKAWMMDSLYFQGGDSYIYGASRAKIDWSGPQVLASIKAFPLPDVPIYLAVNIGRDVHGDRADHNVLLSYNSTKNYWVIGQPIILRQDGSPYWIRTVGAGMHIQLPYGFFLDGEYSRGVFTDYTRTMHLANDERLLAFNGYRVSNDFQFTDNGNALLTPQDIVLSSYLMNARHLDRGHTGPQVVYGVWLGYSLRI